MRSAARAARDSVRAGAGIGLAPLDAALRTRAPESPGVCVFVVGPPRSGTTLLYDLLCACCRVSYLPALANTIDGAPVAAAWLVRRGMRGWSGSFESSYGHISGGAAPSEAGRVWERWFPHTERDQTVSDLRVSVVRIRRVIAAVGTIGGGPLVNKNVMLSVHGALLDEMFPGHVVVRVRRGVAENARSILRARDKTGGGGDARWWSVKPEGWERLASRSKAEQAVGQAVGVDREIESRYPAARRLDVVYEDLCEDPGAVIARFIEFMAGHGVQVGRRAEAPKVFDRGPGRPLDEATEMEIARAIDSYAGGATRRREGAA